jgi:hypothetical protein
MSTKTPLSNYFEAPIENLADPAAKGTLKDLWASKPVALIFLRRLGCQLCRAQALELEELRAELEADGSGRLVCLSFERLGEGSDKDRSFQAGKYFPPADMYMAPKEMWETLFGRKGFKSGYGLLDMSSSRLAQSKAMKVTGNYVGEEGLCVCGGGGAHARVRRQGCWHQLSLPQPFFSTARAHPLPLSPHQLLCPAGDGMQLGGSFVVKPDGSVVLDKRQAFYGDDATPQALKAALSS